MRVTAESKKCRLRPGLKESLVLWVSEAVLKSETTPDIDSKHMILQNSMLRHSIIPRFTEQGIGKSLDLRINHYDRSIRVIRHTKLAT